MSYFQDIHEPTVDTWAENPEFFDSELVKQLGNEPSWAVSDKNKRPIDIGFLNNEAKVRGARPTDPEATVTVQELRDILPDAANAAFHLDSDIHNVCVLDVEPSCPEEEKAQFFNFPYLWAEVSMSGKGMHFVLPVPDSILHDDYARTRAAIRDKDGKWEILLNHWVTFTRKSLAPYENPNGDMDAWEAFAKNLLDTAPRGTSYLLGVEDINIDTLRPPKSKLWNYIVNFAQSYPYVKHPSDFQNDMSRYEFGYMNFIYAQVKKLTEADPNDVTYDGEMLSWLVYDVAEAALTHRPKHEEKRLGMPYLLYQAKKVVSIKQAEEKAQPDDMSKV